MNITRIVTATAGIAVVASAQLLLLGGTASASPCQGKHLWATSNNQVIHGTCGNDVIEVGRWQGVKVYAYGGDDDVKAGYNGGTTTAYLGDGNDEIWTSANSDKAVVAYGEGGQDTMNGGGKNDYLNGGTGNDDINGWGGTDTLVGEAGSDNFHSQSNTPLYDYIYGGTGWDTAKVDKNVDWVYEVEVVTAV